MLFIEETPNELVEFHGGTLEVIDWDTCELSPSKNYDVTSWRDDEWSINEWDGYTLMVSSKLEDKLSDLLAFLSTTKMSIVVFDTSSANLTILENVESEMGVEESILNKNVVDTANYESMSELIESQNDEMTGNENIIPSPAIRTNQPAGLSKKVLRLLAKVEKATGISFQTFDGSQRSKRYKNIVATGLTEVDYHVLGVGGCVPNRIYELFGPEGCLIGSTVINFKIKNKGDLLLKRVYREHRTIEHLYEMFHEAKLRERDSAFVDNDFYVPSIDESETVIYNKIVDVLKTGVKEVFLLKTFSGAEITATKDHKFYVGDKFVSLEELKVGDIVYIHYDFEKTNNTLTSRKSLTVLPYDGDNLIRKSKIVAIESVGEADTYDIKCLAPHNNYIANGIVVHNSGKTTLCHLLMGSSQRVYAENEDSFALLVDIENAFDPDRAEILGVNLGRLVVIQPNVVDNASDALKMILDEVISGEVRLTAITWDSVAAIQTAREYAQEAATGEMMGRALFLAKFIRQIVGRLGEAQCPMFMINQVRDNITSMGARGYSTPGGRSVKHGSSVRLEIKRKEFIGPADEPIGQVISIKSLKNRFSPPFRSCDINLYYEGRPFRFEESLMSYAIKTNVIERKGGTHSYKGIKLASSRANMFERVEKMIAGEDEELRVLFDEIKNVIDHNCLGDQVAIVDTGGDIEKLHEELDKNLKLGSVPLTREEVDELKELEVDNEEN